MLRINEVEKLVASKSLEESRHVNVTVNDNLQKCLMCFCKKKVKIVNFNVYFNLIK